MTAYLYAMDFEGLLWIFGGEKDPWFFWEGLVLYFKKTFVDFHYQNSRIIGKSSMILNSETKQFLIIQWLWIIITSLSIYFFSFQDNTFIIFKEKISDQFTMN